jgi:hypothetical protein
VLVFIGTATPRAGSSGSPRFGLFLLIRPALAGIPRRVMGDDGVPDSGA